MAENEHAEENTEGAPPSETGGGSSDVGAGLAAAIDAGIAEASGAPPKPAEEPEGEPEGEAEPLAGDGAAAGDEEPDEPPEGSGKDSTQSQDDDNRAKPGAAKDDAAAPAKGKPPAAGDAGKKAEPDPVNDPIPGSLKAATKERMQALVGKVKETSTELAKIRGERDEMLELIEITGTTPKQWASTMELLTLRNATDPAQKRQALERAHALAKEIAEELGELPPGADVLEDFDDLKKAVELGDISKAHAEELAAHRRQSKLAAKRGATDSAQVEQQRAVATARAQLNTLGDELKAKDKAGYARKVAVLKPVFARIVANLPPTEWRGAFAEAYENLKLEAPPAPAGGNGKPPKNQPLRGQAGAGGEGARKPKTLEEAIAAGIEEAAGR